jgi:stage V sporulation protein SpoVS
MEKFVMADGYDNNGSEEKDDTILRVNGSRGKDSDKEYVKKLANAVLQTFQKHGVARLRCVGAAALNNADKAVIIASTEAAKKGIELVEKKFFTIVYFPDEFAPQSGAMIEKTGIIKEIVKR